MTISLAVLDTAYGDIDVEAGAAAGAGVDVFDARVDVDRARDADGVLVQFAAIGADEMDAHPNWRVIGRYGVGYDTIDIDAATARGIPVVNVPDYCDEEVSTHAAALALASVRRIHPANQLVQSDGWSRWRELTPIPALSECTLGVLGLGQIGRATAHRLAPFFGRIIAYDPYVEDFGSITGLPLADVLAESDVVSLHLPLSAATHHLIDAEALALMKPTAHLVNVSRGGLVDTHALADALMTGRLAGAALDVLETEPPAVDDPALIAPNLLVTNHIAWYSERSEPRLRGMLAARCAAVLTGAGAPSIVNRTALTRKAP
ncbi:C-terminal binding protein [Mycobacterium sp. AMU20-3851]|uniref:C-terminal binding protein n=1 Tax=Mycobacterium sp. AMU20-3851 TaxID=3122055 RepID=UPI0037541D1B